MDWKTTLLTVAATSLAGAGTWVMTKLWAYLGARASNEFTKGAVLAAQEVVASVVAHAEVTMKPAILAAAGDMLNGKLSAADGANLKTSVMTTLKVTYPDIVADLEKHLGLDSGSATDVYLSGLVERVLGAQQVAGTLPSANAAKPPVDPIAANIGKAAAALTAAAPVAVTKVPLSPPPRP